MITHMTPALAAAGILLMISGNLVWAQQKIEEAGMDIVLRDQQVSELEKGHIVILVNEKGASIADDPSNPLHMTEVDCIGMIEEFPDKTFKGGGYCTNTDREGDKAFARWSASSDMPESRYEIVGGTGKFEGAKGGGTATITELSPGPQGRHVVRWKGSAEYPNVRK